LGFGRLIVDGLFRSRFKNYLRRRYYLGGDGRLRGYPTNQYDGPHELVFNTELRTTSIDILSAQVGMAAFYDAGHAAERLSDLELKQAVGLGLRILFPQANREVFRFDWGLPLSLRGGPLPGAFFVTFQQAFELPALEPPSVTSFVAD
ncbi:MAG TPA: BamA/TamA family outer membrane protein, partial [Polyangiaceae bacterium]|nr:BamA/TamA family outer membrane protein [Polyangiaceae bacterium]